MKRIALIRNSNYYDFGGAEIFPINLSKILKNSYRPLVLSSNNHMLDAAKKFNLQIIKSPWWSFQNFSGPRILLIGLYVAWQMYLISWYFVFGARKKVDVFHPQSRDDFIAATLAAKLLGKKVVWTDHADLKHIYINHKKWYKNPVGKLVWLASKLADHIVLESYSEKKLIENQLGYKLSAKYIVIHLGVVDSYKLKDKNSKKVVFVSTTRLVKDKGIAELIEAYKLIGSKNTRLTIYGDGPDSAIFKSQATNIVGIEMLGHVADINSALSQADILVHPTYHEGFGLSLVEAEMWGLPIIASNVGSIPEIVKNKVNGLLVPSKNIKELAKAMESLANNYDLRIEMGEASRKIYLDNFQFDKIVKEKFIPLYEK